MAEAYAAELCSTGVEWGLIGPAEPPRVWERHLLNCAAVASLVPASSALIDVGSGAGLPGLVLAIARPDISVKCVDSSARRCAFLARVVVKLDLSVEVVQGRAERLSGLQSPVVTARAVAALPLLVSWALPLVAPGGRLLAIKGAAAAHELARVASRTLGGARATVESCQVGDRSYATVVCIRKPA